MARKGMLWLDNERMNELNVYVAEGPADRRGFRRILSSPQHPSYGDFCPAPGHGLGFNELKVIELRELLHAIDGRPSELGRFRPRATHRARHPCLRPVVRQRPLGAHWRVSELRLALERRGTTLDRGKF